MLTEESIEKHFLEFGDFYKKYDKPIKSQVNSDIWLILEKIEPDKELPTFIQRRVFPSFGGKTFDKYLIKRISAQDGTIYRYSLINKGNLPGDIVFRIGQIELIESFLKLEAQEKDLDITKGTFAEINGELKQRRFNLPREKKPYQELLEEALKRSAKYYRSTGYFNSGVLKIYQEPIFHIASKRGKIQLLIDWQGFTSQRDLAELEKLTDINYREQYVSSSIEDFLQKLSDEDFDSTELMTELIRFEVLEIKMVKMSDGDFNIYHQKTGILVDPTGQKILHEGSANFTTAAEERNGEAITFLYSEDNRDLNAIDKALNEFNEVWNNESEQHISFSIEHEFIKRVREERERRKSLTPPIINSFMPEGLTAGEKQRFKAEGENLDKVEKFEFSGHETIETQITSQDNETIEGEISIPDGVKPAVLDLIIKDKEGKSYKTERRTKLYKPEKEEKTDYSELIGYEEAINQIINGTHGTPTDFLLWLDKQNPGRFEVDTNSNLQDWVDDGRLYPHQKDGALLCWKRMNLFGMSVCADSVGLGKTRLAGAVIQLARQKGESIKVAIVAAKKYWDNWKKDLTALGFSEENYELFNKNLMGSSAERFKSEFSKFGGADLVIIDEAHEGIRNYKNRVHKTCLEIRESDKQKDKKRLYLLLTATPWNNRREDIYNILRPFLTKPEGLRQTGLGDIIPWLEDREFLNNFTDTTDIFRQTYKEIFVQRTRKMLKEAAPSLSLYSKRIANWLPVNFEAQTEEALSEIFDKFETELLIPFAQPIRYFSETGKVPGLSKNMKRFFLQRADSSMYALRRTIRSFIDRTKSMLERLESRTSSVEDLELFLLEHYDLKVQKSDWNYEQEMLDLEDYERETEEDYDTDEYCKEQEREDERKKLRTQINNAIDELKKKSNSEPKRIYSLMVSECVEDIERLEKVESLLAKEYVHDHKRELVTKKVKELTGQGKKVLLISTFADTVLDYFNYMSEQEDLVKTGIACMTGTRKIYYLGNNEELAFEANTLWKPNANKYTFSNRSEIFKLFAPDANCRPDEIKPLPIEQVQVLIGSETLSVGQNLQDSDVLINIDLPWNPMILEQRIGRIDRPKQHKTDAVYIFYANSESQLIKQASKLSKLHQKLTGSNESPHELMNTKNYSMDSLGSSVYGDTAFDEEVLPGYVDFINQLIKSRNSTLEQQNLQESVYEKQETFEDLVKQTELQYYEEITKRKLKRSFWGDFEPRNFCLGKNSDNGAKAILVVKFSFFDPNKNLIEEKEKFIFWNDLTGNKNGLGKAIEAAINSPEQANIYQTIYIKDVAMEIYKQFIRFKKDLLEREIKTQEDEKIIVKSNSERLNQIQNRITSIKTLPEGFSKEDIIEAINKADLWKNQKKVSKVLSEFTSSEKKALTDEEFIITFLKAIRDLNLYGERNLPRIASTKTELMACLMRL